jgi:hypothetical protein
MDLISQAGQYHLGLGDSSSLCLKLVDELLNRVGPLVVKDSICLFRALGLILEASEMPKKDICLFWREILLEGLPEDLFILSDAILHQFLSPEEIYFLICAPFLDVRVHLVFDLTLH